MLHNLPSVTRLAVKKGILNHDDALEKEEVGYWRVAFVIDGRAAC